MKRDAPLASNHEAGIYFWITGTDDGDVVHSTHPHPRLPHYCRAHGWWTDKPCPAHEPGEPIAMFELSFEERLGTARKRR